MRGLLKEYSILTLEKLKKLIDAEKTASIIMFTELQKGPDLIRYETLYPTNFRIKRIYNKGVKYGYKINWSTHHGDPEIELPDWESEVDGFDTLNRDYRYCLCIKKTLKETRTDKLMEIFKK